MSDIIIKEVTSNRDLKKFIEFPVKLYKDSPYYVPPLFIEEYDSLRRDKNPAFEYCDTKMFLAYKDNQIVGRVCGLLNRTYNEVWDCRRLRFTRLDFIDDYAVSEALMAEVEKYAREQGMEQVQGPMGFCDLDKQGLLVEGFDEINMFVTPYNAEYYMHHLERLGYAKDIDWIEFLISIPEVLDDKLIRVANIALRRNKLHVFPMKSLKEVLPIAHQIFDLVYDAYKNLYGVIPLSQKQVDMYIGQFIQFLTPEYVCVIMNEQEEPVSFGVLMPSIIHALRKNNGHLFPLGFVPLLKAMKSKSMERVEMLLIATKPEYQHKGLNGILITEIFKSLSRKNVKYAESGPMLETNDKIQSMWNHFENRQHKRRRCYMKSL